MVLRGILFTRFCIDFLLTLLACLFTAFRREELKRKLSIYATLIYWHLKLCPERMGMLERQRRGRMLLLNG
ncbi:MAG: hypothetical protein JSW70_07020 [Syntrophobacterales bacterium]|nr:MAG: hypothetical protein JSW70_07020 [Syntrophobacterales bacterium]